jgi:outer membrane receptor for ferric coprogen and ferric-rhodotorulic acid
LSNATYQGGFYQPVAGPELPIGNNVGTLTEFGAKWNYKPSKQSDIYGSWAYFNETVTNVFTDTGGVDATNGLPYGALLTNTSRGMELEFGMRYTFAGHGMFDVFATGYRADTKAAEYPHDVTANGAPNNVWSILGKYTVLDGLLKGLMIGGGAYGQEALRYEASLPWSTPTIINLLGRYALNGHWSLQLNADNIENKRYIVRIATSGLVEGSLPGTLSLSTKYAW